MKIINTPFSHRKVFIITILIFAVIIFLPIIIIVTNKPAQVSQTPQAKSLQPGVILINPFPDGGRYQAVSYSIAYPKGSQNSLFTFPEGATFLTEPPGYPGEPVLDIEAYNAAQNLAKKQVLYLAEGGKKSTLVINGNNLPELKNTYKTRVINSQIVRTPTQLRLAYLVEPNALYVFRMYYSSSVSIPADEDLFADFIKSFSLK